MTVMQLGMLPEFQHYLHYTPNNGTSHYLRYWNWIPSIYLENDNRIQKMK